MRAAVRGGGWVPPWYVGLGIVFPGPFLYYTRMTQKITEVIIYTVACISVIGSVVVGLAFLSRATAPEQKHFVNFCVTREYAQSMLCVALARKHLAQKKYGLAEKNLAEAAGVFEDAKRLELYYSGQPIFSCDASPPTP